MKRMLFIALAVCSIAMLATSCACSNNQEQTEETVTLESIDLSSPNCVFLGL